MINPNYETRYTKHKNKTLDWLPMDTEQLYQKNLKINYDRLKKFGWLDNHFTYKFNSDGFRCKEFTDEPTILFLGCSHTSGVGLPIDCIWPEIVAKELGLGCANLGIGASSIDTAFRMLHGYVDRINPKIVVLMKTHFMRLEFFNKSGPENLGPWVENSRIYQDWINNENNSFFQRERNLLAIKMICKDRYIKYVEADIEDYKAIDLARDLCHYGIETHKLIANDVVRKIYTGADLLVKVKPRKI